MRTTCGARTARLASGSSPALTRRLLLCGVVRNRLHDRVGRAVHELTTAAGHPFTRGGGRVELTREVRHDVLREQLEAVLRRVWVRPVMTEEEERAEATRLVDKALDFGDRVVGRTDHGEPVFVDVGDDLF